ncbi:tail fiber protein [Agromyces sp. G08B096]|uniref:Tail fiber protein n=1 Tax=Agromyces sp. G08B096 TaxID=3156399 RepID=A0AAU7W547_9MICO
MAFRELEERLRILESKNGDLLTRLAIIQGDLDAAEARTVPTGAVEAFAGSAAPAGWLLCDGAAVSRTTYADLYALIGSTYGAGNGSSTFNLPNLKGRVPVALDAAQAEFNAMGETGGAKTHTLTIAEMPNHSHAQNVSANTGGTAVRNDYDSDSAGGIYPQGINTGGSGGGQAHNNLQPYLVLNFIIRT